MGDDYPRPSFGWDEWGARGQSVQSIANFFDWPQYSICGSRVLVARPTGDANAIRLELLEYAVVSVSDLGSPKDKVRDGHDAMPRIFVLMQRAFSGWEDDIVTPKTARFS